MVYPNVCVSKENAPAICNSLKRASPSLCSFELIRILSSNVVD